MQDAKFEISLKLLNKIGEYLGKKPYVEVATLLNEMAGLRPIVESKLDQNINETAKKDEAIKPD